MLGITYVFNNLTHGTYMTFKNEIESSNKLNPKFEITTRTAGFKAILTALTQPTTPNTTTKNVPLTVYNGTLFGRKFQASIVEDQASYLVYIDDTTAWSITAQKKDKTLSIKDWSQGSYVHKELKRKIEQAEKIKNSNAVFMAGLSKKWQESQNLQSGEQIHPQTIKPPQKANPIMQGLMGYQRTWAELYLGAGQFLVDHGAGQKVGINQKLLAQGRHNLAANHYNGGGDQGSNAYGVGQGLGDVAIPLFGGGMVGGGVAAAFPKAATVMGGVLSNPVLVRAGTIAAGAQIIDGVNNKDARKITSGVVSVMSASKIIQLLKQARSLPELMRLGKNAEITKTLSNPNAKQLSEMVKFVQELSAEKIAGLPNDILHALQQGFGKNKHIAGAKEALAKLNPTGIVPIGTTQSATGKAITVYNAKGANNSVFLARDLKKISNIKMLANAANQEIQVAINRIKAQITRNEHYGKNPKIDFPTLDAAREKLAKLEQIARNQGHTDYANILVLRLKQYKSERTGLLNQVNYVRNEKDEDHSDKLNTPKSMAAEQARIYAELVLSEQKDAPKAGLVKLPSIWSRLKSRLVDAYSNYVYTDKIWSNINKSSENYILKKTHIPAALTPVFDPKYLKGFQDLEIDSDGDGSYTFPFDDNRMTNSDIIRLNIYYADRATELREFVETFIKNNTKSPKSLGSKAESLFTGQDVYTYKKSKDPKKSELDKTKFLKLVNTFLDKPGYDQHVLKHVIELIKKDKPVLGIENLKIEDSTLLLRAIIPNFYCLYPYSAVFPDLFINTNVPLEEIDKFKDLLNKIEEFKTFKKPTNEKMYFIQLLKRYAITKINEKYERKQPLKDLFTDLLAVDTHITKQQKITMNSNDPVYLAYLEKLTQIMKYYLNEW